MTKQEIIKGLNQMRDGYIDFIAENSSEKNYRVFNVAANEAFLELGFCFYADMLFDHSLRNWVTVALEEDLLHRVNLTNYWYDTIEYNSNKVSYAIKNCLQPRLDHLNRTIARLQKEVQE